MAPPFWAFAWAGGLALARHVMAHPGRVCDRAVLDFACGSGLVAIAARRAGARAATAFDIDPMCASAVGMNARLNGVDVEFRSRQPEADGGIDIVLAGDVFYEKEMAETCLEALYRYQEAGAEILVGDPGRSFFRPELFEQEAVYLMKTDTAIESAPETSVRVCSLKARR